jgi:hypothetical protein
MPDDDTWAPPAFDAAAALATLRRSLRELGLTEREGRWEQRSVAIARAAIDGDAIAAAVVRRAARGSPDWQMRHLKSGADLRDFLSDVKRRLAACGDRDD